MNNNDFKHFLAEATRLTRGGDLQAATAAIQAALGAGPATAAATEATIDVEAREIDAPAKAGSQFISGSFANGSDRRDYKLFLPAGAGTTAMPLVVMLHGCTQTPDDFAAG